MRPSPLRCLAAGLFLVLATTTQSTVMAQDPPATNPPPAAIGLPPGRPSLLLQDAVQNDLGLSDKQKTQLNSLQASLGPKSRETFQAAQENGADPQEFRELMVGLQREHQAALVRVLDKAQKSRLAQIELQREGYLAASKSEIASKLKVTAVQSKKIKTILGEMRREQAKAMPGLLGNLQPPADAPAKAAETSKTKRGTAKSRRPAAGAGTGTGAGMDEMGGDGELIGGGFADGGFFGGFPGGFPGGGPPGGLPDFLKPEAQADFAKMQEAFQKGKDEANKKIGEVLTAEQKTAFEKLTGKPFDFSKIDGGGGEPKPVETAAPKAEAPAKKEEAPKAMPKPKSKRAD